MVDGVRIVREEQSQGQPLRSSWLGVQDRFANVERIAIVVVRRWKHERALTCTGFTRRDASSATSVESATRAPTSRLSRSTVSTPRRPPALTLARLVEHEAQGWSDSDNADGIEWYAG